MKDENPPFSFPHSAPHMHAAQTYASSPYSQEQKDYSLDQWTNPTEITHEYQQSGPHPHNLSKAHKATNLSMYAELPISF